MEERAPAILELASRSIERRTFVSNLEELCGREFRQTEGSIRV